MTAQEFSVSPEVLREKVEAIAEIDTQLDAATGGTAGKRAIANQVVAEHTDKVQKFVDSVVAQLAEKFEDEVQVAAYTALNNSLKPVGESVDKFLEAAVAAQTKDAVTLSEEEVGNLSTERKELYEQYKAIKNILEMLGGDISDVPEPVIRRGSRGPRGPRALSQFQYAINGEELSDDDNSLGFVASREGVSTKELKAHIESKNVPLAAAKIADDWEVELPSGATLTANRMDEFRSEEEEEAA